VQPRRCKACANPLWLRPGVISTRLWAKIPGCARSARITPQRRGDFLFDPKQEKIIPRDRSQLESASRTFEWIAPEEIAAATEQVIARSYGIDVEQLPGPVGQIFGFTRTSDTIRNGVRAVVQNLINVGSVVEQGDICD
jgi:hypothetical protein